MLVKVKVGEETIEYNSLETPIAILFTPKDKEHIEKMQRDDLLMISAPLKAVQFDLARLWQWAKTGWRGATYVDLDNIRTIF